LKVHLHHSSSIKSYSEVTKQNIEIKVFFIFLLVDGRIRIRTNKFRIRIQEAQNIDPAPDLEHWKKIKLFKKGRNVLYSV
jgi:hypothetical protein